MSYFGVPMKTTFPPLIARHYYHPGAIPMSGFGQTDPGAIDPASQPWWQQAVSWAQQNLPSSPTIPSGPSADPNQPAPVPPAPAPAPAPSPAPPTAATSSANTLLVAGGIALVGVVGLIFLLKE